MATATARLPERPATALSCAASALRPGSVESRSSRGQLRSPRACAVAGPPEARPSPPRVPSPHAPIRLLRGVSRGHHTGHSQLPARLPRTKAPAAKPLHCDRLGKEVL
ncbi:TPA: hypothetical protein BOS_22100 [Bos taurus]|nr:TPA: hypothetical protein BOS_22100 [Bos taurus]